MRYGNVPGIMAAGRWPLAAGRWPLALRVALALAALALLLALQPAGAQQTIDYDVDDDRLIEISTLAQLDAIRHDLDGNGDAAHADYIAAFPNRDANAQTRMGCPSGMACQGYELTANLTFPTTGQFSAWTPIGAVASQFTATFDGQGYTLTGLTVSSGQVVGLFGAVGSGGVIKNLGIINANVTASVNAGSAGAIAGGIYSGSQLYSSYARGGSVTAAANDLTAGGLVGANVAGTIRASYSTNAVSISGTRNNNELGGLAGFSSGTITASYAAGAVSGTGGTGNDYGGLVGDSSTTAAVITNSYCDQTATGQTACIGTSTSSATATATAYTTSQLQQPTGYTGTIYAGWNLDLSNPADGVNDDPWDFGTPRHYPALKFDTDGDGTATAYEFGRQGRPNPNPPPPSPPPYNPAHDHPEIYQNARHQMATSCEVRTTGEGADAVSTSTITFDLGDYTRPLTLALSLWDGTHFRSLQSQGIAMPELRQNGQTATVEVVTDPAQTRFRLDSEYGLNLVLGYADCHTDDPE